MQNKTHNSILYVILIRHTGGVVVIVKQEMHTMLNNPLPCTYFLGLDAPFPCFVWPSYMKQNIFQQAAEIAAMHIIRYE
jgi:hypothetical protein